MNKATLWFDIEYLLHGYLQFALNLQSILIRFKDIGAIYIVSLYFRLVPELRLRSCSPRKDPGMRSPTKLGDLTRSSPALLRSKTDMHHRVPNVNRSLTNLGGATAQEDIALRQVNW